LLDDRSPRSANEPGPSSNSTEPKRLLLRRFRRAREKRNTVDREKTGDPQAAGNTERLNISRGIPAKGFPALSSASGYGRVLTFVASTRFSFTRRNEARRDCLPSIPLNEALFCNFSSFRTAHRVSHAAFGDQEHGGDHSFLDGLARGLALAECSWKFSTFMPVRLLMLGRHRSFHDSFSELPAGVGSTS